MKNTGASATIRLVCYSENPDLQPLLSSALGPEYSLAVETNTSKLRKLVGDDQVDVLILDFDSTRRPIQDNLALFEQFVDCGVPVVVMCDDDRRSTAIGLLERGAYDYFRKPPSLIELRVVIGRAYERVSLKRELEKTKAALHATSACDQLVGSSGRSQVVYDLVRRVADLNAQVLIRGESGTGKELIARAIHNLGNRANAPFVAVPCGAIPETLIEAELFGHEKGAFTGTAGARVGYMEQVGDGTLFLDEIGELSLQTQVKLLRVLQEKEFCRLGSSKLVPLRARVVAATHRSLEQMVDDGTFRMDLFFRLNVIAIQAPALRERTEDIPLLAKHFLRQYTAAFNKPVREIRPAALQLLVEYEWPGNVRELENAIQSAVILTPNDSIGPGDLPASLRRSMPEFPEENADMDSFEGHMKDYKMKLANRALLECNGNKTLAARKLQISRAYLHRLIRPLGEVDAA